MSYDEHLISMAGGDGDNATDQLAAIEARAGKVVEWRKHFVSPQSNIDYSQRDVPALLALVRDQQAKLDRVAALADGWESNAGTHSESARVFGPQKLSVNFAVDTIRDALDGFECGRLIVGDVELIAHDVKRVGDAISYGGHLYVRAAITATEEGK